MRYRIIRTLLIMLLVLRTNAVQAQGDCSRVLANKQSSQVLEGIERQTQVIEKILAGETNTSLIAGKIFGIDYDVQKTEEYVRSLEQQKSSSSGVSSEHSSLYNCLGKLRLEREKNLLSEKSIRLTDLKIALFKKNNELRDSLRLSVISQGEVPALREQLNSQKQATEKEKRELERDLLKSEDELLSGKAEKSEQEAVVFKSTLTKTKIDLLNKKIEYNKSLQQRVDYFEEKLKLIAALTSSEATEKSKVTERFEKLEAVWKSIIKENFYQLFNTQFKFRFPDLPSLPTSLAKSSDSYKDLLKQHQEVQLVRQKTISELTQKKEQELKMQNELLIRVNSVRGSYFKKLPGRSIAKKIFSKDGVQVLKDEIVAAPYRFISFFYSKYFWVRERVSSGKQGITSIALEFFKFICFIAGVFAIRYLFRRCRFILDRWQHALVYRYRFSSIVKNTSSVWNKLKDNLEHFLWLGLIYGLESTVYFKEFYLAVEVAKVWLIAKIIKSFVIMFFGSVSRIDVRSFEQFKLKATETARRYTNIYLFYALVLIMAETTVGHVYIYILIKWVVLLYALYQVVHTASVWEDEFRRYIERQFSGAIIAKLNKFFGIVPGKLRAILILFFILVLSLFDLVVKLTENFEVSKKISANVFKKQIENVEAEDGADDKIPQEYKEHFTMNSVDEAEEYVVADEKNEQEIKREFTDWIQEKSDEHCLVVYGDKGIGKTTLLKHVVKETSEEHPGAVDVVYVKMPSKTTDKQKLDAFIANIFEQQIPRAELDLHAIDRQLTKKTIVVIDEAQNVFLSKTGGFEAYYALINNINLNTEKIFWVMSFNKYSWIYLDRAFGRTQFFRNVFELRGWNDSKIKELIMRRHAKTSFKLSYDLLINATRSQDEIDKYSSIESKFFKLLWELSRGNPRAALHLWMTALSRKNRATFNVNIPRESEFSAMEKLSDNLMFVMSHVLKHENLSTTEVEETTNLPRGIVRNAIKVAYEKRFLFMDDRGRHMIEIGSQYGLIKYLRLKNFVYGN